MLADLEAREGEGQVLRLKWKRRAGGQGGGHEDEVQYGPGVGTVR